MNTTSSPLPEQSSVPLSTPPQHPWEKYLPSKRMQRVLLLLVILAIIILLLYWLVPLMNKKIQLSKNKENASEYQKDIATLPQPITTSSSVGLSIDTDTDSDGIPDWQETLIGTNPTIPTSESEVPKELREIIAESAKTGAITTDDKLALKVYQRLATDPKGEDFAQALQAATAKEVLDLANTVDKGMTSYTLDDLNISDPTRETATTYLQQTRTLLKDASIPQELQEKIYTYLMKGGEKDFGISTYQTKLGSIVGKLLETSVTVPNADYYLQVVNALAHMNQSLSQNSESPTDQYVNALVFQKNLNIVVQFSETLTQ